MPRVTAHPTPNPNSLKFTAPGGVFIASGLEAFASAREAERHPLGAALFALDGVANVLILPAFVTVTKAPAADWDALYPAVERVLDAHLDAAG